MRSRFCQAGGNDNKRGMSGNCLRLGVSAFLLIPVDINKMNRYHEKEFTLATAVAAMAGYGVYVHQIKDICRT